MTSSNYEPMEDGELARKVRAEAEASGVKVVLSPEELATVRRFTEVQVEKARAGDAWVLYCFQAGQAEAVAALAEQVDLYAAWDGQQPLWSVWEGGDAESGPRLEMDVLSWDDLELGAMRAEIARYEGRAPAPADLEAYRGMEQREMWPAFETLTTAAKEEVTP